MDELFHDRIEKMFLRRMLAAIESGEISEAESGYYAKAFLAIEPFASWRDLLEKFDLLTQSFPLFRSVYTQLVIEHAEIEKQTVIDAMHAHLKSGNVDAALAVVHKQKIVNL